MSEHTWNSAGLGAQLSSSSSSSCSQHHSLLWVGRPGAQGCAETLGELGQNSALTLVIFKMLGTPNLVLYQKMTLLLYLYSFLLSQHLEFLNL